MKPAGGLAATPRSWVTAWCLCRILPALISALAQTVLEKEKDEKHIFDLASGGFASTVRLAKSGADMWTPILLQNSENVLHVMDTYMDKLKAFRDAIAEGDDEAVRELINDANRIRRIIR